MFGSPAWIRTTITIRHTKCASYRLLNGLKCRIGPEKPALVHNSYTESHSQYLNDPAGSFKARASAIIRRKRTDYRGRDPVVGPLRYALNTLVHLGGQLVGCPRGLLDEVSACYRRWVSVSIWTYCARSISPRSTD